MARKQDDSPQAMTGSIRSLKVDKGFGFILGPDGVQYFFHKSDAANFDQLLEGSRVRFTPADGNNRGPRAAQVSLYA